MKTTGVSGDGSPALQTPIPEKARAGTEQSQTARTTRVRTVPIDELALIGNPHSGCGSSAKKLAGILAELKKRGIRHRFRVANSLEEAERLSREANGASFSVVVAVGGDGTINRVLNGFYDRDGNLVSRAAFGVIHTGSSPDFCRSYRIPTTAGAALETLLRGETRPLRPLRIVRQVQGEERVSSVYACCANIGLGAEVARGANSGGRERFGDFFGTLISLLRALRRSGPFKVQIEAEGSRKVVEGVLNLAVGRSYYVASGLKVRNELHADDERFYVLTLRRFAWRKLGWLLRTLYGGRPITSGSCLTLEYARHLQVAALERRVELEFDGDPAGWCPCSIQAARGTIELICTNQV